MVDPECGVDPVGHSRDLQKTWEQSAAAGRLYARDFADGFGYSAAGDFTGAICVGGTAAGVCRGGASGARYRGNRVIVTARWGATTRLQVNRCTTGLCRGWRAKGNK